MHSVNLKVSNGFGPVSGVVESIPVQGTHGRNGLITVVWSEWVAVNNHQPITTKP